MLLARYCHIIHCFLWAVVFSSSYHQYALPFIFTKYYTKVKGDIFNFAISYFPYMKPISFSNYTTIQGHITTLKRRISIYTNINIAFKCPLNIRNGKKYIDTFFLFQRIHVPNFFLHALRAFYTKDLFSPGNYIPLVNS